MIYKYFTRKSLFLKDSAEIHPKSLTLKGLDRGGVETSSFGDQIWRGIPVVRSGPNICSATTSVVLPTILGRARACWRASALRPHGALSQQRLRYRSRSGTSV